MKKRKNKKLAPVHILILKSQATYIIPCLFIIGLVTNHYSANVPKVPKVGQCFERRFGDDLYEIVKVVGVNLALGTNAITYVYNMPNAENFEKGKWYSCPPLNTESVEWFTKEFKGRTVREIECPW